MYISLHHQLFITAAARIAEETPRRTRICYMMAFRSLSLFVSFLVYTQFLKSNKLAIWIFWPVSLRTTYSQFNGKFQGRYIRSSASPLYLRPETKTLAYLNHQSLTYWLGKYFKKCDEGRQYIATLLYWNLDNSWPTPHL